MLDIHRRGMYYSVMKEVGTARSTNASAAQASKAAKPSTGAIDEVMFALMQAAGAVERRLEEALAQVDLSMPKFRALTYLVRAGDPVSLGECAANMTCVRSNITQLVDRLEAEGLVRRVEDPNDRRGVRAMVTPLGMERQAAGAKLVEQVQKQFAKSLSGVDRDALTRALEAVTR